MELYRGLGILLLMPMATLQLSDSSSLSYIGAVAEYSPVTNTIKGEKPDDVNAKNYLKFIKKAAEYSVDILAFPEYSLSISVTTDPKTGRREAASYVPDPQARVVLCENTSYPYSLRAISCAAREHRMYVVVNHGEKVDCQVGTTGCPKDGLLIYNTNVAFDRQGRVIARYRKYNLYNESHIFNHTAVPELSTFETDFGVTFGQFICADLIYANPALNLTRDLHVTDIVFPSQWFSTLPILYSVQVQAGWAYVNDVNLLAAGYSDPKTVNGGSGIYIGRKGYSGIFIKDKASNVLIVSEVPKVIEGKRLLDIDTNKSRIYEFNSSEISTSESRRFEQYTPYTVNFTIYTTKAVDPRLSFHEETVCNRGLCCDFKLRIKFDDGIVNNETNYYRYRLAAFNGTELAYSNVDTTGWQFCGLISCVNDTLSSCGKILDPSTAIATPTSFQSLEITMRDISNENVVVNPVSLSRNMLPLNATDYSFQSTNAGETSTYSTSLTKARNDLLTFGIYGRNFAADNGTVTM